MYDEMSGWVGDVMMMLVMTMASLSPRQSRFWPAHVLQNQRRLVVNLSLSAPFSEKWKSGRPTRVEKDTQTQETEMGQQGQWSPAQSGSVFFHHRTHSLALCLSLALALALVIAIARVVTATAATVNISAHVASAHQAQLVGIDDAQLLLGYREHDLH
jgi:hypothetical protein